MALYIYTRFDHKIPCFRNLQQIMCCRKVDFWSSGYFHETNLIREENIGTNYLKCGNIVPFKMAIQFARFLCC